MISPRSSLVIIGGSGTGSTLIVSASPEEMTPADSTQATPPFQMETSHADQTAATLRDQLKGLVHDLELCWSEERVILTGQCPSYHAKQMVSAAARQLVDGKHICNQICVER
ncbi:MAG: hypothetical protein C0478_10855 [Planctomyces sp.]|nr:hypothetical protein [Planctomyces sp.]